MAAADLADDYRVQELLTALNEGILELDFVKSRITGWAGDKIDLIRYSDGEYGIICPES
jgi:hypothetical protein